MLMTSSVPQRFQAPSMEWLDQPELGEAIKRARLPLFETQSELVSEILQRFPAIGSPRASIATMLSNLERGFQKTTKAAVLFAIQEILEVQLTKDEPSEWTAPVSLRAQRGLDNDSLQALQKPHGRHNLYATTAGAGGDVMFFEIVASERVESVPASLEHVATAFAFRVSGTVMGPIIQPGHLIWVNPSDTVQPDGLVLLVPQDSHLDRRRYLRQLISETDTTWTVQTFVPPTTETLEKKEWPHAWRVSHIEFNIDG